MRDEELERFKEQVKEEGKTISRLIALSIIIGATAIFLIIMVFGIALGVVLWSLTI